MPLVVELRRKSMYLGAGLLLSSCSYLHTAYGFHSSHVSPKNMKSAFRHGAPQYHSGHASVISSATTDASQTEVFEPVTMQNPVILFDGVCNFCNTWVDILLRIDTKKRFKFAPLQSKLGQNLLTQVGKESDDISSVVLVQPDLTSYDKSACVLQVVRELGPIAGLMSEAAQKVVPESLRDQIYDTVAENRYNLMGKRDECRSGDPDFFDRFIS